MAVERLPEEPFAQLYVSLIRDPDLSDAAYRVYSELLSYRWQNESCFPGQKRIGAEIGKSERGVRNALIELESKGLIQRHHRGQRYTDEYTFPDRQNVPTPHESLDRQILPFPIDSDRQKTTDSSLDRQITTSPDRQETTVKEETIEKEEVIAEEDVPHQILSVFGLEPSKNHLLSAQKKANRLAAIGLDPVEAAVDCHDYHIAAGTNVVSWMGRFNTWVGNCEERAKKNGTYTIQASKSNGGFASQGIATPQIISPRTVVKKSRVPEWDKSREWIVNCGTCRSKDYNEFIDQLQPYPPKDGTMRLAAPNESIRESVVRRLLPLIDDSFRSQKLFYTFEVVVAR